MTTKTAGKTPKGQPEVGPLQPDLHAAYQAHTLARMLYGQLATTQPWIQPTWPTATVDPLVGHPPTPWHGPMKQPFAGPTPFFGSDVFPR